MERQEGYYWVKYNGVFCVGEWVYFTSNKGGCWLLTGNDRDFQDRDLDYINEVRIKAPGEMPD